MKEEKKLKGVELEAVTHVKKTFARELSIRRQKPYQFMKEKRISTDLNSLNKMLEGKSGCSILTLARIADAFGYDIQLIKRQEDDENQG